MIDVVLQDDDSRKRYGMWSCTFNHFGLLNEIIIPIGTGSFCTIIVGILIIFLSFFYHHFLKIDSDV
jgi:hypothetical protein